MKNPKLRLVTSGCIAVVTAMSTNLPGFVNFRDSQFSLLSPAFAQNVDEQINIRVYEQASPAVVSIEEIGRAHV